MTKRTERPIDPAMWTVGDIEAQIEENVKLRQRVTELEGDRAGMLRAMHAMDAEFRRQVQELEAYAIRAQDAFRRALLLEIPSAELRELRDSAPVAKPEIANDQEVSG